jgi:hypothetical protein
MSQANPETHETITSGVNERRFLEHLKTFFSTSTVVLAEVMQNARRAKAAFVWFNYDADSATLEINDDGCGIESFQALITAAESGWSEQTKEEERPFGIGFYSVAFAADRVLVQSRGKEFTFSAEDLIEKRPIIVKPSLDIKGTRIFLYGCKLQESAIEEKLKDYASGFAIRVFYQDVELARPYAKANLSGVETPVGFVCAPEIHSEHKWDGWRYALFCQGLPIYTTTDWRGRSSCCLGNIIIHVDHKRYLPRIPDRDMLIDSETADRDFEKQVKALWREHLLKKKATLSALDFANTYWDRARKIDSLDLFCDVPVLPASVLSFVHSTPYKSTEDSDYMKDASSPITMDDVMCNKVELYRDSFFSVDENGDFFARLVWAQKKKVLFVKELPKDHWATLFLQDLAEKPIKIGGRCVAKQHFGGEWFGADIKLMDNLSVTMGKIRFPLEEAIAAGDIYWKGFEQLKR